MGNEDTSERPQEEKKVEDQIDQQYAAEIKKLNEEEKKLKLAIELEKKRSVVRNKRAEYMKEKKKNKKPGILDSLVKNFGGGAGDNDFGF